MPSRTQSRSRSSRGSQPEEHAVVVIDPKAKAAELQRSLEGRRDQFVSLLGGDSRLADRFLTIALDSIVKPSNNLLDADPLSILNAVRSAAMMGLEPAGPLGEGAIVAYKDRDQGGKRIAQFQPMYRGLRKLALQHPDVTVVNVGIRHEKDVFEYREGSDPYVHHVPWIDDEDPGAVMGAYAYARLRGETLVLYMNLAQIRKRQNVARTDKVWQAWPEEMMKKTVLRRLITEKLPMTLALSMAVDVDEADLDRVTVTTTDQRQLAAPGSRTRARHSAADDVEGPDGAQDGAGAAEEAEAGTGATPPDDDETGDPAGRPVCGAKSDDPKGPCVRPAHGDHVNHRNADGETWKKTPGDSADG